MWGAKCTKIAHRHSLAIFNCGRGIAIHSGDNFLFLILSHRGNCRSPAIFGRSEISHLGASI